MCGIFAYANYGVARDRKFILDALYNGLRRLEYRGYDSAGIAIDDFPAQVPDSTENGQAEKAKPIVIKAEGKIDNLVAEGNKQLSEQDLPVDTVFHVHTGIAHTRWATHGPPEPKNSHPHTSGSDNEFVVVHNGIITNYKVLKEMLIRKGFTFVSDTDTEVIPLLAKYLHDSMSAESCGPIPFRQLVTEVVRQLDGAYALLFKSSHYPGEIVACKRGSPLILGIREKRRKDDDSDDEYRSLSPGRTRLEKSPVEYFFASDPSAVVEHTKSVLIMEDDDMAHLFEGSYGVFRMHRPDDHTDGAEMRRFAREESVHRVIQTLEIEVESIMKGEYDHFMQKEIHEQPESLTQTMRGRLTFDGERGSDINYMIREFEAGRASLENRHGKITIGGLRDFGMAIRRSRRLIFIGCGTSYHAALASRSIVEELVELPVALELASDLQDRKAPMFRDDTVIAVSQSGETADTLEALKYAQAQGCLTVGITNTVGSAIARATDCGVHINAGCEIGVASTKAYTSQIVAITMMALALCEDSIGKAQRRQEIMQGLVTLPLAIEKALALRPKLVELSHNLSEENSLLVFGRGFQYATALEAALKVKEVALMHSEGILAGEMKHGPLALVDSTLPLIVIATRDHTFDRQHNVVQQLLARHARLIIMCSEDETSFDNLKSDGGGPDPLIIRVPQTVDCLQSVVNMVPLQLLSYHLTVIRGHDVDQPRNLAKSVTVM
mmetsp:Transcript_40387/g.48975  ORF Transcript_40387/g.48975 Transcript_40387/m.48975 type:complete len:723 (-) Transcript_40387:237-2405(-)|eukprot:CAMPEP_0197855942 /NCGR_PEP_ID=MMETSP1438-20131217/27545_1 /TAXON_ID=1461541 /ORGANISM="Pterosperma sp., Strain CCMP1384" /LENGTH=722 /DNA_ID=CAMNT_0043471205 /DNA_START=438 /DNA_END=2606 /DNA_ORIENTATION=+